MRAQILLPVGIAFLCAAAAAAPAAKKPAVLFATGGLHTTYFTQPLHAEGVEVHVCGAGVLPELLPTGKYNVVVVTGGLEDARVAEAVKAFLAAGGGVMALPGGWGSFSLATQKFLQEHGAQYGWVLIGEKEKANTVSSWHAGLIFTDNIAPPFNAGVPGVLFWGGTHVGASPPISVRGDANWTAVVKGSPTSVAMPYTDEKREAMRPYIPKEPEAAPSLLSVREVGQGRLAALGITPEWLFVPPSNCPPVEDMLTRGAGGKPSNWVRLLANVFRWLAEPTSAAGKGGEPTPAAVLNPPVKRWEDSPLRDWTKAPPLGDQEQLPGLVGARSSYSGGKGTVEEWVKAAKAAGLKYLVFLEPLEFTDKDRFTRLSEDCAKFTDDTFFACPGLWTKDVYGNNSMFVYGEDTAFPLKELLTADGKFFDNSDAKKGRMRFRFDYFMEQNGHKGQIGFFRHRENNVPVWEYKIYNSFVVFSTEGGKVVDDCFDDFASLQANNLILTPCAVSLMDDPAELARAVKEDWLVVNTAPGEFGDGTYSEQYGPGIPAMRKLFKQHIAWIRPFQYITQGPRILCWDGRWPVVVPHGEWFRPDLARYRARLHVASDVGIKEIKIMSVGRVLHRFLPRGAKEFDQSFEFENSQQRVIWPVIEDVNGKRAVGAVIRNANTLWNEFICSDRMNYLSYGISRTKDGQWYQARPSGNAVTHNKGAWYGEVSPATSLTLNYPTLPVDGAPIGNRTPAFFFYLDVSTPGFISALNTNCRPKFVTASPDVIIGGGYLDNVIVDPTAWGNAWSWWSAVKPNECVEGCGMHTAFNALPGGMRAGWYEFRAAARKELPLTDKALPVRFISTPFTEFRDGEGKVHKQGDKDIPEAGSFKAGAYVLVDEIGGPAGLVSMDDRLAYRMRGGGIEIGPRIAGDALPRGAELTGKIGYLGAPAGTPLAVLANYFDVLGAPPAAVKGKAGAPRGDHIAVHCDGKEGGVSITFPATDLRAFWPVVVENMQPNWDVWLLDRALKAPNWRQLPTVEGAAYAVIPSDVKQDLFLGHPVLASNPELKISLCNTLPGEWLITLHNPTDAAISATVWSAPQWSPLTLKRRAVTIPAGSSVDIPARGKRP